MSAFSTYTVSMFRRDVRNGPNAWPGGYPLYFLCSDGGALCFGCAYKERGSILQSIHHGYSDGWRVVACDVNWEDNELYCDHCSEKIDPAYPCAWSVTITNVGRVYEGNEDGARQCYDEYVSGAHYHGRADGETMTLCDGDGCPVLETVL